MSKETKNKGLVARRLLVKALRSGKYRQGHGQLFKDGKRCCLGVACAIYNDTHKNKLKVGYDHYYDAVSYDGESQGLPEKVQDWLGGFSKYGDLVDDCEDGSSLTDLNDESNFSFKQIAQIIEDDKVQLKSEEIDENSTL